MPILYAVVARGTVVLAEHNSTQGNTGAIARKVLEKIATQASSDGDSHLSYSQDRYVFHAKRTDGITVLCMADDNAGSTSSTSLLFIISFFVCLLRSILISFWLSRSDICQFSLCVYLPLVVKLKDYIAGLAIRATLIMLDMALDLS
jgi:Regulated-SNARE-like domain